MIKKADYALNLVLHTICRLSIKANLTANGLDWWPSLAIIFGQPSSILTVLEPSLKCPCCSELWFKLLASPEGVCANCPAAFKSTAKIWTHLVSAKPCNQNSTSLYRQYSLSARRSLGLLLSLCIYYYTFLSVFIEWPVLVWDASVLNQSLQLTLVSRWCMSMYFPKGISCRNDFFGGRMMLSMLEIPCWTAGMQSDYCLSCLSSKKAAWQFWRQMAAKGK